MRSSGIVKTSTTSLAGAIYTICFPVIISLSIVFLEFLRTSEALIISEALPVLTYLAGILSH